MNRLFLAVLALLVTIPLYAQAATLYVSPASISVSRGDIVTVRLIANTQGVAINQGEGKLVFPTDMLSVVSASKSSSIFTLWVEEPTYSNIAGTVSFDGGVPTPGFTGSSGTIISITFQAKKTGTATLSLTDAALRANDGLGTDVLSGSAGGQILIQEAAPTPTPPLPPPSEEGGAPTPPSTKEAGAITHLTSPTHSNQDAWYQAPSPLLTWDVPEGASSVQTIVDTNKNATPSVTYKPAITERRIANLEDGIWYFTIRARVGNTWGPTASYTLRIDTTAPEVKEASFAYDASTQSIIVSSIGATDTTSGITSYELIIDGESPIALTPEAITNGTYRHFFSKGGTRALTLRAYDAAGNYAETSGTITVPTPLIDQTLFTLGTIQVTFLWFILLILLISLLSCIAAITAWYKLFMLREGAKSRIEKRDKILHRSLRIYKEDLERHLRTLERAGTKRELTDEEAEINEELKKNVDDLERYLAKEFKKYD